MLLKVRKESLQYLNGLFASLQSQLPILSLRVDCTILKVIVYQLHLLLQGHTSQLVAF